MFGHQNIVGTLYDLATGEPPEAGAMAFVIFLYRANIDEISGFPLPFDQYVLESRNVDVTHPVFSRQSIGVGFGCGGNQRRTVRGCEPCRRLLNCKT